MSCWELIRKMLELRPGIKLAFMSSYTEICATAEGLMDPRVHCAETVYDRFTSEQDQGGSGYDNG